MISLADIPYLTPLLIPTIGTLLLLGIISWNQDQKVVAFSTAGLFIASLGALITLSRNPLAPHAIGTLLSIDSAAVVYMIIITGAALCTTLFISSSFVDCLHASKERWYVLLLLSHIGAMVLATATHCATFILGLELLSVSLYGLIAYTSGSHAIEASVKYLVLAGSSTAFLLFGLALIYAETGTLEFAAIAGKMTTEIPSRDVLLFIGFAMSLVGIGFKLSLVPFHLWAADIYQGAPTVIGGLIATVSKVGVVSVFVRFFSPELIQWSHPLQQIFWILAVLTMLGGNLLALAQTNVKRLLAGSSIAHFGYILVAFLASGSLISLTIPFYLATYTLANLSAFGIIHVVGARNGSDTDIHLHNFHALAKKSPLLTTYLIVALFSLAGIPITAGFIGKFLVITAGIHSGFTALVIVLILTSVLSVYYYFRVCLSAFIKENKEIKVPESTITLPFVYGSVLLFITGALLLLGTYPSLMLSWIQSLLRNVQ